MAKENVERIFSGEFLTDSKHKLNTTNKVIPASMLENIEHNGITLEQLNELSDKGFDIFKYHTQITLHGICKELSSERINGYKLLTLNKNKSIGIKWNAIDNAKKREIIHKLSYFGWSSERSSTELYPRLLKHVKDYEEAKKVCSELKTIAERIDEKLFYGNYVIQLFSIYGSFYAELSLYVNGILACNVDKLISQILDKDINEVNAKIQSIDLQNKIKWENWNKECQIKWEKSEETEKKVIAEFNQRMLAAGYKQAKSNELSKGTLFIVTNYDSYKEKMTGKFWIMQSRYAKRCDKNGKIDEFVKGDMDYKKYAYNVWIKA